MHARTRLFERFQLAGLRAVAACAAALSSMWLRHTFFGGVGSTPWQGYVLPSILAGVLVGLLLVRLPARAPGLSRLSHGVGMSRGVLTATLMLLAMSFFYRAESYSRGSVLLFVPVAFAMVWTVEKAHLWLIERIRTNDNAASRVLIVGSGDQGRKLRRVLAIDPSCQSVVGYIGEATGLPEPDLPILGSLSDLKKVVTERQISTVAITSDSLTGRQIQDLIGVCMALGANWILVPPIFDMVLDRLRFEVVDGLPIVSERGDRIVGHEWFLKRAFDLVTSATLTVVASPLLVMAAVAIRLSSKGPIIYRQRRIGMNGKPFTLYKFRTMVAGVETESHQRYATQWIVGRTGDEGAGINGAKVHKLQDDGRVTPVGRVLRATSIDELPQLWNVLKGDMSLVGPRPPIPYEVAKYTDWHRRRLSVPPGVTGPWQVGGRNSLSFDDMVRLDLEYIERWSLGADVKILVRTVPALLVHRGS